MPTQVIQYRCLLMSPSDVTPERDALTNLVTLWNAQIGRGLNTSVELVRWESHAVPDLSKPPQDAITSQIVNDCDFGIAVFWSKLGTATKKHPSGSVEEIYTLLQKGARVLVYFSSRDIPQDKLKDDQFAKLQEIKQKFSEDGLYAQYTDIENLCSQVQLHLTNIVTQLLAKDRSATPFIPASGTLTAPTPDVRVTANPAFIKSFSPYARGLQTVLDITVANHSPIPVYIRNITVELKGGNAIFFQRDDVSGQPLTKQELNSGQSYTVHIGPERLRPYVDDVVCARVTDEIGRVYRSDLTYFADVVKVILSDNDG